MCRQPVENAQVIATLFGRIKDEDFDTIDAEGRLSACANPWAKLYVGDLSILANLDTSAEFIGDLDGRVQLLFDTSSHFHHFFINLDLRQIKAQALSHQVAPPGQADLPQYDTPISGKSFTCNLNDQHDRPCLLTFSTARGLLSHQRNTTEGNHGYRQSAYLYTISNICPVCMQTFSNRPTAQAHLQRTFDQHRCLTDSAHFDYPIIEPDNYDCPSIMWSYI